MKILASEPAQSRFELCGGHPALDFVNSLDDRFEPARSKERLADYATLLRFAQESELLTATQARGLARMEGTAAATRVLRAARELREAMAAVLYAQADGRDPPAADVEMLQRRFHDAERPLQLQWVGGDAEAAGALHWQWSSAQVKAAGFPLWRIAQAASQLMLSDALGRVRACEAERCRWLFLDTSKNHTRRWCNMKICGNRAKARRFQERRAE
ncbi:MAG TPA: CGNR zinc finger domain-containing protein [Steroidobacteraceae bacterium]|jgi:predicted RNA-binding Zn ribbon-like protein